MSTNQTKQDVFKFVSIREPERFGLESDRFLLMDESRETSTLFSLLINPKQDSTKKLKASSELLNSDHAVFSYRSVPSKYKVLVSILTKSLRELKPDDRAEAIEEVITKTLNLETGIKEYLGTDSISEFKRQIWDTIYAATYTGDNRLRCMELVDILRSLIVFMHWPEGGSVFKDVSKLLELDIKVDKRLFPSPDRLYDTYEAEWTDKAQEARKARLDRKQTLANALTALSQDLSLLVHIIEGPVEGKPITKTEKLGVEKPLKGPIKNDKQEIKTTAISFPSDMSTGDKVRFPVKSHFEKFSEVAQAYWKQCSLNAESDALRLYTLLQDHIKSLYITFSAVATSEERRTLIRLIIKSGLVDEDRFGGRAGDSTTSEKSLPEDQLPEGRPEELPTFDPCERSRIQMPAGCVRPIGVGDLNIMEQTLIKYEAGDVAHIENIMAKETRERTHRRLDRTETMLFSATEQVEEKTENLKTSDRFEMSRESEQVLESRMHVDGGLTVSGSYGSVDFSASANASYDMTRETSERSSVNYAREVSNEARSRIEKRVREEERVTTIREIEETNLHNFKNESDTHICGTYRWVNKQYCAQVVNYGKRLFFEFMVPEPAAFFRHVHSRAEIEGVNVAFPEDPGGLLPEDLFWFNYTDYANRYGARGIEPPPPTYLYYGKALGYPPEMAQMGDEETVGSVVFASDETELPDGYAAIKARADISFTVSPPTVLYLFHGDAQYKVSVNVGAAHNFASTRMDWINNTGTYIEYLQWSRTAWDDPIWEQLPITATLMNVASAEINVQILCKRTDEEYMQWQIDTWEKIMHAYQQRLSEYNEAVRAQQISRGVVINGANPLMNREFEKRELEKHCIHLLTGWNFLGFGSVFEDVPPYGYPEFNTLYANWNGEIAQFFEQAFEWSQMTYVFYPYFWSRKGQWPDLIKTNDVDPLFQQFLQAGFARVMVPVRPGYEKVINYYINTGVIWQGAEPPTIDDEQFISIIEEFREAHRLYDGVPVGQPWKITIPTNLVTLCPSDLPTWEEEVTCIRQPQANPARELGAEGIVLRDIIRANQSE